ncbi:hypothetical protein [Sphingomonas crocodyli]|uniref:MarR family transcriptional regulator n=1 Tax=Sphingomonas crocodyli TaxID=1979270 RepID=A0A437M6T3_9SPHN|nr:hypothetical protein [Sphingomonas crocodyli]RVT93421.1 hypothetical protein EOD43_05970 [Sphingomonas crocodyli]
MVDDLRALGRWSLCCTYIAKHAPSRLAMSQLAFFAAAALYDRAGQPQTMTELRALLGDVSGGSIKETYAIFLSSRSARRDGLGWLVQYPCPFDARRKLLCLTARGRWVIEGVLKYMAAV